MKVGLIGLGGANKAVSNIILQKRNFILNRFFDIGFAKGNAIDSYNHFFAKKIISTILHYNDERIKFLKIFIHQYS